MVKWVVGTITPISTLCIPTSGNTSVGSPLLTFPHTDKRYKVGIGSSHFSGVGQSLLFYAGDSGNGNNNLGSSTAMMRIMSDGATPPTRYACIGGFANANHTPFESYSGYDSYGNAITKNPLNTLQVLVILIMVVKMFQQEIHPRINILK